MSDLAHPIERAALVKHATRTAKLRATCIRTRVLDQPMSRRLAAMGAFQRI